MSNARDLMARARQAVTSAQGLLTAGDLEGATNRAYYAMFHAAHAALASQAIEVKPRSHGALSAAFGRHLVKAGLVPASFGRSINKVQELRHDADYEGPPLQADKVAHAVEEAGRFVSGIEELLREKR